MIKFIYTASHWVLKLLIAPLVLSILFFAYMVAVVNLAFDVVFQSKTDFTMKMIKGYNKSLYSFVVN